MEYIYFNTYSTYIALYTNVATIQDKARQLGELLQEYFNEIKI